MSSRHRVRTPMRWTLVAACPICHTCHTCHVSHTNGSLMRTAPSAVLLSVLTPLAVVALPVVSAPHPAPHPVRSEVRSQALHGVELAAVGSRAVRGSARAAFQASRRPAAGGAGPQRRAAGRAGHPHPRRVLRPARRHLAPGDRPGRPHRPGAHPRPQGLDRLDRAGRHRHTCGQRGQGGPSRHRAALGRRLGRLPGPGRRGQRRPAARPAGRPGGPGQLGRRRVGGGRPADAVGAGRGGPAADLHPGPVGRGRVDPRQRAEVQLHDQGRLRAPHGRRQRLLRGRGAEDPPRHLRLPRQGQRLVGHRLQLPGRPVRPALGGPVRRDDPCRRRRPHRWLQRRQLRGVGARQLRQGRCARGDGRLDRPADGLEAVVVLPRPERHDGAHLPGRGDVEVPRRHQGHLRGDLRAPGRRQHVLPGHQPLHPARDHQGADDHLHGHRPARPAARAGQRRVRQRRQHHHGGPGHQRPGLEPADHGLLPRHRRADPDRDGIDGPPGERGVGPARTTRGSRSDPGPTRSPSPAPMPRRQPARGSAR